MHYDDGLPEQCIVFDRAFDRAPFYLRVKVEKGIDMVELEDASGAVRSLPAAIVVSIQKGYVPTHWMTLPGGSMMSISPDTIKRVSKQFGRDGA